MKINLDNLEGYFEKVNNKPKEDIEKELEEFDKALDEGNNKKIQ